MPFVLNFSSQRFSRFPTSLYLIKYFRKTAFVLKCLSFRMQSQKITYQIAVLIDRKIKNLLNKKKRKIDVLHSHLAIPRLEEEIDSS